jgi:sugar O-acyltransferase (sialic acid O-acetyltransferase NeuD family)
MTPLCVIVGGGGHARVLIDCLRLSGAARIYGVLDPDRSRWGQNMLDVPIVGGDDLLAGLKAHGVDWFAIGLGGTGDNRPRRTLFELALSHGLRPLIVQHPTAIVSSHATIGEGCQLLPGCIVNAGAMLGVNVIVNSGAIVEHDCMIGNHVHIATGAQLASTVRVGDGAHIGAGATIRQSITIGEGSIVGAGAVVVKDVSPYVVVAGVPAHPLREVVR